MWDISIEFIISLLVYAVSFGTMYGSIITRLKALEKQLDGMSNISERVAVIERDVKSAHRRIDEIKEAIKT